MMIRRIALIASLAVATFHAWAMDVRVAGNQLILSGMVTGDELAKMRDTLPENSQIDTVILHDSLGGDAWTAMRLAELFHEKGYRTAASGFCMSACVIILLGGRERHFADGEAADQTYLAIHTPTFSADEARDSMGSPSRSARSLIYGWMGKQIGTGGDLALIRRGLANDNPAAFVYFYDATRNARKDGVSVFECEAPREREMTVCETVPGKSALQAGLITSDTIVHVNK